MDADDLTIKALRAEVDFRAVTIEGLLKQRDEAEAEVERLKEAMGNGWPLIEKERARVAELTRERGITDGAFQKFRDESYAREAKGGLIRTGLEEKCKRLEGALREITEQNDYAEYHSLCIARRALADEEGKK
jgi:hypothetical protein